MQPPLCAVLFDFGGVLSSSPFEAFTRFERERGLPEGFLRRVNANDPHANAWARLERSEISVEEFDELFASESEALGHRVNGREVLGLLVGDLRPEMVEAVRRCHERLKTGLLTNNFVAFGETDSPTGQFRTVLEHFDVVVESSRVGIRKPEPRFYELACEQLDIAPTEAVFLDDLGTNLKPARSMGMRTIKVVDPAQALAELEAVVGFRLRDQ
ncbi:MAG: HAD-IA family hydrolase [Acidimicrobiales bacterium]|nr:HAD-IA family hydrolase [Acidimicrobiales bacterium]